MKQEHQEFFCEEVRRTWQNSPMKPRGVWIRRHAPVSAPEYSLTTDVLAAWFLDSEGVSVRTASEFVRFYTMHETRPWHSGAWPPSSGIFQGGTHEIGLAGFAEVTESGLVYFEWQLGGTFGRGSLYGLTNDGRFEVVENVFIS